jgi:hypothetical protein
VSSAIPGPGIPAYNSMTKARRFWKNGACTIIAADAAPLPAPVEKDGAPPVSVRVEFVSAGSWPPCP